MKQYPIKIAISASSTPVQLDLVVSREFYLYAPNASDKEDWFFALRHATRKFKSAMLDKSHFPHFMTQLDMNIRDSSVDRESQWINAILGRIFYNFYRSSDIERYIRTRFNRKLSMTELPFFIVIL